MSDIIPKIVYNVETETGAQANLAMQSDELDAIYEGCSSAVP